MDPPKGIGATNEVLEYLKENIRIGTWKPGDKIPSETKLCSLLGTSRVSVRSALSQLAGLGLVQSHQGRGTFVCTPAPVSSLSLLPFQNADRLSIFEFRKIIESESAALAAIRASSEEVAEMQEAIFLMEQDTSDHDVAEQDMRFHYLIASSSGNEIIRQIFDCMRDMYAMMFEDNVSRMGNIGVEQHRQILLDIQTRNPDAARQHMLTHIGDTIRFICKRQL